MLVDLLSMSNYGHYNIKLAQLIGLDASVYLCELMNVTEKATRKKKMSDNFFTLDRDYITDRTTIDLKRQLELDEFLYRLGIITPSNDDKNTLSVDVSMVASLVTAPDEDMKKEIRFCKKENKKTTKKLPKKLPKKLAKKLPKKLPRTLSKKLIQC